MIVRAPRLFVNHLTPLLAACCLLLPGCAQAETDATADNGSPPAESTQSSDGAQSAGDTDVPSKNEKPNGQTAFASVPPTVYDVAQVIDVRKLPRLEVTQSYDQQVGSMFYVAKGDLETAAKFYERLFLDSGWQLSQQMGGRITTEDSAQMGFGKDGFLAFISVSKSDEDAPDQISVSVNVYPNFDAQTLPHPDDCEVEHASQANVMYVTETPIKDTASAFREKLTAEGWIEHGLTPVPTPNMAVMNFVKNGLNLLAYIASSDAYEGRTMVQLAFTILAHDVPVPAGAKSVELRDSSPEMTCIAPTDMDATVAFYRDAYPAVGYEPVDELTGVGAEKSSLVFRPTSTAPAEKIVILVELTASDAGTKVKLQPLADDVDPAQLAGDPTEPDDADDDPVAEEMPADVPGLEDLQRLAGSVLEDALDELPEDTRDLIRQQAGDLLNQFTDGDAPVDVEAFAGDDTENADPDAGPKHPAVDHTFGDDGMSIKSVAISPDGKSVATGGFSFHAYDIETGEPLPGPDPFSDTNTADYSPDGKYFAIGLSDGGLIIWDLAAEEELVSFEGGDYSIQNVKFSPDGKILAVGDSDGDLSLLDVAKQELIETYHVHDNVFNGLAFTPDGKQIVTARDSIRVWNVADGEQIAEFKEPEGIFVGDIAVSPDGKTVAVACFDTNVELWDLTTKKLKQKLEDHREAVAAVAYSPDGKILASGSWGFEVVLWDAESGERLRVLTGHAQSVNDVAFSADGTQLATGADDGLTRIWNVKAALEHPEAESPVADLADSPYGDAEEMEAEGFEDAGDFADDMPEQQSDVDGIPLPPDYEGLSTIGSQFAKTIETSVQGKVDEVLDFYAQRLPDLGYERGDSTKVDDQTVVNFAGEDGPLVLKLEKFGAEVRITIDVKNRTAAEEAGILPKPGKARIIVGNDTDTEATIKIGEVTIKVGPKEGNEEPNGPTADIEPGTYTLTVLRDGEEPVEEEFIAEADQTWGCIVIPPGPIVLPIY